MKPLGVLRLASSSSTGYALEELVELAELAGVDVDLELELRARYRPRAVEAVDLVRLELVLDLEASTLEAVGVTLLDRVERAAKRARNLPIDGETRFEEWRRPAPRPPTITPRRPSSSEGLEPTPAKA